jgi:phosphate/sulfate permease
MPNPPPPPKDPNAQQTEQMRITYAFWLATIGLGLAAGLVVFLVNGGSYKAAASTDIVAIVGLFTSVLGTLVGAFFGLQIGSAGKEKADQNAQQANDNATKAQDDAQKANVVAQRALAALAPEHAQRIVGP